MIVSRDHLKSYDTKVMASQRFLYRTFIGRVILKILTRPFVSKLGGAYLSSRISKRKIKPFIKKNAIVVSEYEMENLHSFNDFFSRKIKDGARTIDMDEHVLISPCDSKLSVYKIEEDSIFCIKDSYYRVSDLLNNESLAREYIGGHILIFRLCVDDYHRYCYIDSGTKEKNISIPGVFHTVNPIALEKYNFFKTNAREYTVLHTDHFGDVVMCEVGALMVGKIKNHHEEYHYQKGEEKGMFLFGGSTICVLVKDIVEIDSDLLKETSLGNETIVKYGEGVGKIR